MNSYFNNQYYNNSSNQNDRNRVGDEYYNFLRNIYDKNSFEQQQEFNNFLNKLHSNEPNQELENMLIKLRTERELKELNNQRCKVMNTYHNEEFQTINSSDKNTIIRLIIFFLICYIIYKKFLKK
jgi:hypothetical protein